MLHPHFTNGESPDWLPLIAADDPIGAIPDLQPVIHDFERDHARNNQRRQQKKRSERPPEPLVTRIPPDENHHVDDFA